MIGPHTVRPTGSLTAGSCGARATQRWAHRPSPMSRQPSVHRSLRVGPPLTDGTRRGRGGLSKHRVAARRVPDETARRGQGRKSGSELVDEARAALRVRAGELGVPMRSSRPGRASSTWPSSSTPAPDGWSAGRWPTTCALSWSSTPSTWRSGTAARPPASSTTPTVSMLALGEAEVRHLGLDTERVKLRPVGRLLTVVRPPGAPPARTTSRQTIRRASRRPAWPGSRRPDRLAAWSCSPSTSRRPARPGGPPRSHPPGQPARTGGLVLPASPRASRPRRRPGRRSARARLRTTTMAPRTRRT